jgi:hypothetical protein
VQKNRTRKREYRHAGINTVKDALKSESRLHRHNPLDRRPRQRLLHLLPAPPLAFHPPRSPASPKRPQSPQTQAPFFPFNYPRPSLDTLSSQPGKFHPPAASGVKFRPRTQRCLSRPNHTDAGKRKRDPECRRALRFRHRCPAASGAR